MFLIFTIFTIPALGKNSILIVGDSLSAGYGLNQEVGWVSLLKQKLQSENYDYEVKNVSVSGNTTSNGLAQLKKTLTDTTPTIALIQLGGNDGLRGLQIATIRNNLQSMIDLLKEQGSRIILLGLRLPPNYGAKYTEEFSALYTDLGEKNNVAVVPLFLKNVDDVAGMMQADRIHPTIKAQSILLNNVWEALQPMLAR